MSRIKNLASEFSDPSAEWRSVPFWSLNDELEGGELKRQLARFKDGGFGGAYLHSRIGLLTEYLGEDWWKAMDAGVEACEKLGIEAWFYDEDKWPSGFAGGLVPEMSESFHARHIARYEKGVETPKEGELLADDGRFVYLCCKDPMGNAWFNGTCWVDLMNPEMVKAFIDCSYRPYAERYKGKAGAAVKGIFTDEPQFSPHPRGRHSGALPYSPFVREEFKKRNGYDFAEQLPSLFDDAGDYKKLRLDYYRTLAACFESSFSKQIGDYCEKNGLVWTGHYNGENAFWTVRANVGNMMAHYRHMQRPGIDHLGLAMTPRDILFMMRSLSSVANQYGRERRLSEMFGISGQNMNFEDRKWIAGGHAVLGINHVCPHLSLYSMKGCRKRDYPPTISPQQPYWAWNSLVEDQMARACVLSSAGDYAPEALVLSPLESSFIDAKADGSSMEREDARFTAFSELLLALQQAHRDYDLGDELIMADDASVEGPFLKIGKMRYPAVVVSGLLTIRASTLKLLASFAANGGKLIIAGEAPELLDGRPDASALAKLKDSAVRISLGAFASELAKELPPNATVEGANAEEVWTMRRTDGEAQRIMLYNHSRAKTAELRVSAKKPLANPSVWNPDDGSRRKAELGADGSVKISLAPSQILFVCDGDAGAEAPLSAAKSSKTSMKLEGPWKGRRLDPNSITLDFARYSVDGGKSFSEPEPVIGIYERFTERQYSGPLSLRFEFDSDIQASGAFLVLEQPEMYKSVKFNGAAVDFEGQGFWRDFSFRKGKLSAPIAKGRNAVELSLDFKAPVPASRDAYERYGSEIESVYVIGNFAVEGTLSDKPANSARNERGDLPFRPVRRFKSFRLAKEKDSFNGDLCLEGYPFYAGAFELERSFEIKGLAKGARHFLSFPETEAVVVCVELNGKKLPPVAWSPWEAELTGAIKEGENVIKLSFANSLRNLLGPHHHKDGELTKVGPKSFDGSNTWTGGGPGDDDWYDVRLAKEPRIWRDDYHNIPFGLLAAPAIEERL